MDFSSRKLVPGSASASSSSSKKKFRTRRAHLYSQEEQHFGAQDPEVLESKYPNAIQFYDVLPGCNIGLLDFEALALERLKVLRAMEKVSSLCRTKYSPEWIEKIDQELRHDDQTLVPYSYYGLEKASNRLLNRERDHFSHFILRLAYCKSEDLRRWFLTQESDLFRYRCISARCLKELIEVNELDYVSISDEEMEEVKSIVYGLIFRQAGKEAPTTFYKVPFTEALDLVKSRKVLIKNGFCYVPDTEMISLVSYIYKSILQKGLIYTYKVLPNLDEDERLSKVLFDLDKRYVGSDFNDQDSGLHITPDMIKPMSEKHFPLCMKVMQNTINLSHHLKYRARLQYGLFLKGIGLSLDDAIKYFRGEFTKSHIAVDKFDKEYVYGIRYNYGKEGKKVNWAPWNCMRIIMETVGPGENHGCPYRHFDPSALSEALIKSGIEGEKLKEILQLSKDGHYQKACSLQFKASHDGMEISSGMTNHPNQFYLESLNGGAQKTQTNKLKTERVNVYTKVEQ